MHYDSDMFHYKSDCFFSFLHCRHITVHSLGQPVTLSDLGNATWVPENPGNLLVFKPVNPGLCAGKNPDFTGLNFGCQYCTEKHAETESS